MLHLLGPRSLLTEAAEAGRRQLLHRRLELLLLVCGQKLADRSFGQALQRLDGLPHRAEVAPLLQALERLQAFGLRLVAEGLQLALLLVPQASDREERDSGAAKALELGILRFQRFVLSLLRGAEQGCRLRFLLRPRRLHLLERRPAVPALGRFRKRRAGLVLELCLESLQLRLMLRRDLKPPPEADGKLEQAQSLLAQPAPPSQSAERPPAAPAPSPPACRTPGLPPAA